MKSFKILANIFVLVILMTTNCEVYAQGSCNVSKPEKKVEKAENKVVKATNSLLRLLDETLVKLIERADSKINRLHSRREEAAVNSVVDSIPCFIFQDSAKIDKCYKAATKKAAKFAKLFVKLGNMITAAERTKSKQIAALLGKAKNIYNAQMISPCTSIINTVNACSVASSGICERIFSSQYNPNCPILDGLKDAEGNQLYLCP